MQMARSVSQHPDTTTYSVWSTWGPKWFVRSSNGERVSPLFGSEYEAVAWASKMEGASKQDAKRSRACSSD